MLRDKEAVSVLFDELASRFADRDGGYTRIVRLAEVRLGDAGAQALIEFVGERDRVKSKKRSAPVVEEDAPVSEAADNAAEDETAAESDDAAGEDADAGGQTDEENSADDESSKAAE